MRFALASLSLSLSLFWAGACQNAVKSECAVAADCGPASLCIDGSCVEDERIPVLPTEGEGEVVSEGEGEVVVGEGEGEVVGEGEGEVVVGEGEGEVVVGEGEGEVAVGEGEGEPAGSCTGVVCPEFQACTVVGGEGVCDYDGDVCEAFQDFGLQPFADISTSLSAADGSNVHGSVDPAQQDGDHLLDAFLLDVSSIADVVATLQADTTSPPPVSLVISMATTTFDPFLAVLDDGTGQCTAVLANDDTPAGDTRHSQVVLPLARLASDDNSVVATSFATDVGGAYDLRVRPNLCGLETDSLETFDGCARALSTRDQSCVLNNPCERDASPPGVDGRGNLTGFACCIKTGSATGCGRSGTQPIIRFAVTDGTCGP